MTKQIILIILACLLSLSLAEQPPAATADEGKVKELLIASGQAQIFKQMLNQMSAQMGNTKSLADKEIQELQDEYLEILIPIYAKHFTNTDLDKAIEFYKKALELDSGYKHSYNNLGNVYSDLKDYHKAIDMYQKAIDIDPKYAYPFYGLGIVYSDLKISRLRFHIHYFKNFFHRFRDIDMRVFVSDKKQP